MKTPAKREPRWEGVRFECQGKEVARLGFLILPDSYNPDAPRWQRQAGKNGVVAPRRKVAAILRDWRASGDKNKDGTSPFASALVWLLRNEMEKEAAHV